MGYKNRVLKSIPEKWKTEGTNLIYFGDFHHRKVAPTGRIDDYHATEFNKVKLIRDLAKEYNAKAILQPGDFLDKPKLDDGFLVKVMKAWGFTDMMQARTEYEAGNITKDELIDRTLDYVPMVGLIGNHELYGGSLSTYSKTSIAFLVKSGFINLISQNNPYIINTDNGGKIAITGSSYDSDLLTDNPDISKFEPTKSYGDVNIFMVHEALYDTKLLPGMNWLPIDKIADSTIADLTLAGHIHTGYGFKLIDGKIFGNPGALDQKLAEAPNRVVTAAIIHVTDENKVLVREVALDTPVSSEIYDTEKVKERVQIDKQMKSIKTLIDSASEIKDTKASEIINKVSLDENIPNNIRKMALDTTGSVESSMKNDNTTNLRDIDKTSDYRIDNIHLQNFESHLDTTIELDKKSEPTLLIGESSQGKSSVLRAIYWVLEGKGDSKQFIRRHKGINSASVEITRMDGLKVKRYIELNKNKNVKAQGYIITRPDGSEEELNTSGIGYVQSLFGMNYLDIDKNDSIPLNFMKQEDGWYFIGLKGTQRAKVVGAIYGTQYIMGAIKEFEADRRKHKSTIESVKESIKEKNKTLELLKDVDSKKTIIDNASVSFSKLKAINSSLESIQEGYSHYRLANKKLSNAYSAVTKLEPEINSVSAMIDSLSSSKTSLKHLQTIFNSYKTSSDIVNKNSHLNSINTAPLSDKIESARDKQLELKKITKLLNNWESNNKKVSLLSDELSVKTQLDDIQNKVVSLKDLKDELLKLQNFVVSYDKLKKSADKIGLEVNKLQSESDEIKAELSNDYHNYKFGRITIMNIKMENEYMSKEKLSLTERLNNINENLQKKKIEYGVAKKQVEDSEKELSELGLTPEEAPEKIASLDKETKDMYTEIETKLTEIESSISD